MEGRVIKLEEMDEMKQREEKKTAMIEKEESYI